jgi:hypothetical protein
LWARGSHVGDLRPENVDVDVGRGQHDVWLRSWLHPAPQALPLHIEDDLIVALKIAETPWHAARQARLGAPCKDQGE